MQEAAHAHDLEEWDAQIRARNDELTRLTSENTRCLTAVAEYTRSQMDMENSLANTQVQCSPHSYMYCYMPYGRILWDWLRQTVSVLDMVLTCTFQSIMTRE